MKDSLGQPIQEGDILTYSYSTVSDMYFGEVIGFTPKMVKVRELHTSNECLGRKDPDRTVNVTEQYKHFAKNHPELLV